MGSVLDPSCFTGRQNPCQKSFVTLQPVQDVFPLFPNAHLTVYLPKLTYTTHWFCDVLGNFARQLRSSSPTPKLRGWGAI